MTPILSEFVFTQQVLRLGGMLSKSASMEVLCVEYVTLYEDFQNVHYYYYYYYHQRNRKEL